MGATYKLNSSASPVTVASAGTAVQLATDPTYSPTIVIQAAAGNAGKIYVGDENVDSTNGIELDPGESVSLQPGDIRGITQDQDLSQVWVDAANNGDEARVLYYDRN